MRCYAASLIVVAALLGCEPINTGDRPPVSGDQTTPDSSPAPDNTAVNRRDADMEKTKTPIDQSENQADVSTTAEIRKRILDTPDLSVNARNAKVITASGKVTLRGPVNSESEKELLAKIATAVAGEGNVDNQLEVAANR